MQNLPPDYDHVSDDKQIHGQQVDQKVQETTEFVIEKYKTAVRELQTWIEEHGDVYEEYVHLKEQYERATEEMKAACRMVGGELQAGPTRFVVTPSYKKWLDYETLTAMLSPEQMWTVDTITTVTRDVDMKKFQRLCDAGLIPEEARLAAYREEEKSKSVRMIEDDTYGQPNQT